MVTRTARGKGILRFKDDHRTDIVYSIIQDCEDALTNWTESKAAVRSRLSVRGSRPHRTGGRASRSRRPVSLTDQDRPMSADEGWVPADEHERNRGNDDEYEDIVDDEPHKTHTGRHSLDGHQSVNDHVERGREPERQLVAEN